MLSKKENRVIITDVTLREYGQNITSNYLNIFTTEKRIYIAQKLIDAGFKDIEVLSCVHPKIAPAMNTDSIKEIAHALGKYHDVNIITLAPNLSGYKNFCNLGLGPDQFNHTLGIFFSAIEEHNLLNLGRSIDDTVDEYKIILKDAVSNGIRVVAYISAVFGYLEPERNIVIKADLDQVHKFIDMLFSLGVDSVSLSDLQGLAQEDETGKVFETIMNKIDSKDIERLGYHPHNINSERAISNSKIAYDLGIRRFDSSLGGSGGCITGAPGNQSTEGLVSFFNSSGIDTQLDEKKIFSLARFITEEFYNKIPLKANT